MVRNLVKLKNQDQNLLYSKILELNIGTKCVKTPRRALHLKPNPQCESRIIQASSVRGINEIFLKLTKEKIFLIDSDLEKLTEFGKKLRYVFEQEKVKNELNLLFFGYENKQPGSRKNKLPTDKEIEYLCNITSHPSSDIIIPPIIEGLKGDDYLEFLKKFLSRLTSFKKNPTIMGSFPFVATRDIRKIGSFYMKKDINMFTIDFNGKNPLDFYPIILEVNKLTKLIETEFKEDSFIHGFNVPITKTQPKTEIGIAKDVFVFTMGMDSFGSNHRPSILPLEVIEKIKKKIASMPKQTIKPLSLNFRLFNRKDYGYYKFNDAKKVFNESENMSVKIGDLMSRKFSHYQIDGIRKTFNVERQAFEANEFQSEISENTLKPYLENKKYGTQSLNQVLRIFK